MLIEYNKNKYVKKTFKKTVSQKGDRTPAIAVKRKDYKSQPTELTVLRLQSENKFVINPNYIEAW